MGIRLLGLGARMAILVVFAIFFIAPVLWLILAPTKSDHALITSSPFSFGSFHNVAQAWKHLDAYSDHLYRRWIANTLIYSLSATAITLAVSIPAGYGLALGKFPGRKLILTLTLVVMIMPAASLVLPIFLELNALHLIGSVFSVILPFSFFPFGVYLAYIYYATSIPSELLDAARVDGCGEFRILTTVVLRLAKPAIAAVALFSFLFCFNDFFGPLLYTGESSQHWTLSLGLAQFRSLYQVQWNLVMAATVIVMTPVIVLFFLAQRAFVEGVTLTGVKG